MSKLILVSFADKRYRRSLIRLEKQTKAFPFDERHFLTQDNCLTKEYWRRLKPWLYRRGFGYWSWKFPIIKSYFEKLEHGDYLFFTDAGIMWNSSPLAIARFNEYIEMLSGENDILVFRQEPRIEQEWTKGDIFEAFGVYNDDTICKSKQYFGGIFCLKKTKRTCDLVERMIELGSIEKELITDKRSSVPNKEGFIENRHDQSLFSILVKTYPHVSISYSKSYELDCFGRENKNCPIQVVRQKEKERPLKEILKNKTIAPWRKMLNFYFKRIRDYEYQGDYVW